MYLLVAIAEAVNVSIVDNIVEPLATDAVNVSTKEPANSSFQSLVQEPLKLESFAKTVTVEHSNAAPKQLEKVVFGAFNRLF